MKTSNRCLVCLAVKKKPELTAQIRATTYFQKQADTSLLELSKKLSLPYDSLRRHASAHMGLIKASELVQAPQAPEKKDYIEVWDTIIAKGTKRLKGEEFKVTPDLLMKATKAKFEFEAKMEDNQLEVAKMMYEFASGEKTQVIEGELVEQPAARVTAGSDAGEGRPGSVYSEATGDAAAPRPNPLP